MAVPKKKVSKSRRNMRRSHHALPTMAFTGMQELRRAEAPAHGLLALRLLPRGHARPGRRRVGREVVRQHAAGNALAFDRRSATVSAKQDRTRTRRHGRRSRSRCHRERRGHRSRALSRHVVPACSVMSRASRPLSTSARGSRRCSRSFRRKTRCWRTTSRPSRCAVAASPACGWRSRRRPRAVPTPIVSAGNTGALLAISMFAMRMLEGADRPALASFMPTSRGETVMLDLGANLECDAENLAQFAVMGSVFAQVAARPRQAPKGRFAECRLGGTQGARGSCGRRRRGCAAKARRSIFHGFVEGNDIGAGVTDVVVTDGFTGNMSR